MLNSVILGERCGGQQILKVEAMRAGPAWQPAAMHQYPNVSPEFTSCYIYYLINAIEKGNIQSRFASHLTVPPVMISHRIAKDITFQEHRGAKRTRG